MRISVAAWAPEYGAESDLRGPDEASVQKVDPTCEGRPWTAVPQGDHRAVEAEEVVFIDGVRRTDARLFVTPDDGDKALAGLAVSLGVGAVSCSAWASRARPAAPARVSDIAVNRYLAVGGGREAALSAGPGLEYSPLPVEAFLVEEIDKHAHDEMRKAEANLAVSMLSRNGADRIVFVDGPFAKMNPGPRPIVGVIKSHSASYLEDDEERLVTELGWGERTPLFYMPGPQRARYSWYLRLCERDSFMHGWHGVIRCEAPAAHPIEDVVALADASTALLPRFASQPHWDKRAPQNLVPIAGLERKLRHMLGDRELALRKIRAAAQLASQNGGPDDGG